MRQPLEELLSGGKNQPRRRGTLRLPGSRELLVERSLAGAYERDGAPAMDTFRQLEGASHSISSVPPRLSDTGVEDVCSERVIWAGNLLPHYGHFLTESVARLWPLLPGGPLEGAPAVFVTPSPSRAGGEWLRAFGVDLVELPASGAVRFTSMFVPETAWRLWAWIAPEIRDIHLHARRNMQLPPVPPREVLWLSRTGLEPDRIARDERLLEWILGDRLTRIWPEAMTIAEQVAALEACDAVAGVAGSAFHTLLMTERTPDSLYLCPAWDKDTFTAQHQLLAAPATFAQALTFPVESAAARGMLALRQRNVFPEGYFISIPAALRALDATVLPGLLEDARIAAFAQPEPAGAPGWGRRLDSDLDAAVLSVLHRPLSLGCRSRLGDEFEGEGLASCAREQYEIVESLTGAGGEAKRG